MAVGPTFTAMVQVSIPPIRCSMELKGASLLWNIIILCVMYYTVALLPYFDSQTCLTTVSESLCQQLQTTVAPVRISAGGALGIQGKT